MPYILNRGTDKFGPDVRCAHPTALIARFRAERPLLKPLDMSDAICRDDVCLPVEGNVLIYHGAHHLSPTYVRTMAGEIGRQIAANTGWW